MAKAKKKSQGKIISAATASDEIGAFLSMIEPARPLVVKFLEEKMDDKTLQLPIKTAPSATGVTYFRKDVNAFVFDKELVTRFFETKGPNGVQKPADVLLVFLGMVKDDADNEDNVGTPTVILAGCHQEPDGTFKSMNLPGQEATEYPPKKIIQAFPAHLNSMIESLDGDETKKAEFKAELNKHLPLSFKIVG